MSGGTPDPAGDAARLALAQEAAGFGLWDLDVTTGAVWVGRPFNEMHGLPTAGRPDLAAWLAVLDPLDRPALSAAVAAAMQDGTPFAVRVRVAAVAERELRWVEVRGRRLDGPHGAPLRLMAISLDVTEQQLAAERTALLMREVDHRARNTLSTVQALLRLTRAPTPQAYARVLEGRIAALGRAQALLQRVGREDAALRALLAAELAPYESGRAQLMLTGPPLSLAAASVQPLSMAIHELATNAAKYGALSVPGGRIAITWRVEPGATAALAIDWQESGGPPVPGAPAAEGFGSVLMRSVMAQLGGTLALRWDAGGLVCAIRLPAAVLAVPGPSPPG